MRPAAAVVAALLLLCSAGPLSVSAIYQDQAGQYDWMQQYVGRVKLAQLVSKPRARLYVASEAGVVAALSPTDGKLLWRRVLAEGDAFTHMVVLRRHVVTLSGDGSQLLAWDAETGAAVWAAALGGSEGGAGGADLAAVGSSAVAVAVAGSVQAFDAADGRALWSAPVGSSPVRLFPAADGGVWALPLGASPASTHISGEGQVAQQDGSPSSSSQPSAASLAALSADGSKLCAGAGGKGASCQAVASLLPPGADATQAKLLPGSCGSHAVLQAAGGAAVLALDGSGGASAAAFLPGATASGCFPGHDGTPLVAFATPDAAGLRLQVWSAADGSMLQQQEAVAGLAPRLVGGEAVGVAALFAAAAPAAGTLRQLVVFEDDSLALVRDGQAAWLRHEELASVTDVLFTDLAAPTPENEAQWLASQPSLGESLRAQLLSLKLQASVLLNTVLLTPEERAALERHRALTNDKLRPTRDPDGFRKQAVVLTAGGKVLALHNGDGRVLWSVDFGRREAPARLALWRVPHDVQHDIEVAAIAVGGGATTATVLNAHTGAVQQWLAAPLEAADLLPLPAPAHDGTADQRVYVAVPPGTGGAARLLPDTAAAQAAFAQALPGLAFWRVDAAAGTLTGLGFTEAGVVEERWSAALAPPTPGGPSILTVAAHTPGEAVFSPARVVGSGQIKFKYLNPNTLLVAVGWPSAAAAERAGGEPSLTVVLLDAVTGRVLHSQTHQGACGPVHAVLSENMAAYHFWGVEAHRWQVASLELFDASPTTLRVADLAFAETNATASSWDVPPLEAGSQTFLARLPVSGLAVTRSARGSTAKQVLLLGAGGQVALLDRRFLDPRRPIVPPGQKPTPEQAAEGLPAYQPELPLAGTMFATLDREVKRLRGVAVEAAELESTQLMLAHGLDLFYTRLTPSKSFDMVPDDFPYALLVLILLALFGSTAVLSRLQKRGVLKAKWQ